MSKSLFRSSDGGCSAAEGLGFRVLRVVFIGDVSAMSEDVKEAALLLGSDPDRVFMMIMMV